MPAAEKPAPAGIRQGPARGCRPRRRAGNPRCRHGSPCRSYAPSVVAAMPASTSTSPADSITQVAQPRPAEDDEDRCSIPGLISRLRHGAGVFFEPPNRAASQYRPRRAGRAAIAGSRRRCPHMSPTGHGRPPRVSAETIRTGGRARVVRDGTRAGHRRRGRLHFPYGWLPGRANGDQGCAGAGR
jgi:hypothetical protein